MNFELAPLPYPVDALEPHLSARTLEIHHGRHHRGYLEKLETAIAGTPLERRELEEIMLDASGPIFESAAQVWNHDFYWKSMTPGGGGVPTGAIGATLVDAFGHQRAFRERFMAEATSLFGSGYVWLALDPGSGGVEVVTTHDADNPLLGGRIPLLCMDVWEHAYYLDHQNLRKRYTELFLDHLVNWSLAQENLRRGWKRAGKAEEGRNAAHHSL